MIRLLAACAAAPFIIACTSANAADGPLVAGGADAGPRVLMVNGDRIEVRDPAAAAEAIEAALERNERRSVDIRLNIDESADWDAAEREAFAEAMAILAAGMAREAVVAALSMDQTEFDLTFDAAEVGRHVRAAERHAARAADHATDADAFGRRMERLGLEAGLSGMAVGERSLMRALERGWFTETDERIELDDRRRAEFEEALAELRAERAALEARLAELGPVEDGEGRDIRIVRRNGETRAWVNGREVSGAELDSVLAGPPDAPAPPPAPNR